MDEPEIQQRLKGAEISNQMAWAAYDQIYAEKEAALKVLRQLQTDGIAVEECSHEELQSFIAHLKRKIDEVINIMESGDKKCQR